jgi:C4-dicarboxylate-specific signal transduction histidine kinase
VRITLALATHLPLVARASVQLRQLLLNLVRNAFEAMHQGEEGSRRLVVRTTATTPGAHGIVHSPSRLTEAWISPQP